MKIIFFTLLLAAGFLLFLLFGYAAARKIFRKYGCRSSELSRLKPTAEKDEAGEYLCVFLNEYCRYSGREIGVYEGIDCPDGTGWLFFWDSVAFIRSKNPEAALKGSNPVYYNRLTGEIRFIPQQEVGRYIGKTEAGESSRKP